jgi:hypothetical protein
LKYLTVVAAAERVKRDRRTVERWIAAGLATTKVNGVHYIAEETLLEYFRARLLANPSRPRHARRDA